MQRATKEVLYFETAPDNPPTLRVEPGEEFEVETQMNRGPWLDSHPRGKELREELRGGNPSSGCIYVEDAQPGQVLVVNIGRIDLDDIGFTNFRGSTSAMPGWLGASGIGAHHRIVRIQDDLIHWDEQVRLPVESMLGFVGVAPEHTRWENTWAGDWGGNLDIQEVTTGASVHLRVNVPRGAASYRRYARQAGRRRDLAGGIETGGRVRIRCELTERPPSMTTPRIEDDTHIMTVGIGRPAEDAFRSALEAMILCLEGEYGFERGEAYLYLGQVLEARCTQFVNPHFSYVAKVARRFLPKDSPKK